MTGASANEHEITMQARAIAEIPVMPKVLQDLFKLPQISDMVELGTAFLHLFRVHRSKQLTVTTFLSRSPGANMPKQGLSGR